MWVGIIAVLVALTFAIFWMIRQTGSRLRIMLLVVLWLGVMVAVPRTAVHVVASRWRPPGDGLTLEQLVAVAPPPQRLAVVHVNGARFFSWFGESVHEILPSGPSCIVFDASGNRVAFTPSTGDGELAEFCDYDVTRNTISLRDALATIPVKPGTKAPVSSGRPE